MSIHDSPFSQADYEKEKSLMIHRWKNNLAMNDELYRKENQELIQLIINLKPNYFLSNSFESDFTIDPQTQLWAANLIQQYFQEDSFIKKAAIIPNKDFISRLSSEQSVEEIMNERKKVGSKTQVLFFENEADALTWLQSE